MKNHKSKKGFTLIELLVVIAIIGLLSTLAVVSLGAARERARDVKRIADLSNLKSALELYASDQGTYPIITTSTKINGDDTLNKEACLDASLAPDATPFVVGAACTKNLMTIPKDTVKDYIYEYKSNDNGTTYTIWVQLEAKIGACATPEGIKDNVTKADCMPAAT